MTPEEQLELDTLKQELRIATKLLENEKGKVKAMELNVHETKRNAKIATEQADCLKAETESALATGAAQMQIAHAISCGIFGMAELSRAQLARKVAASRVTHREETLCSTIQAMIDAVTRNDQNALKNAMETAKQRIAVSRRDGEANRLKAHNTAVAIGLKNFDEKFTEWIKEGNE